MITCVTAPSRSGTSLTMQMLQAAGVMPYWNLLPNKTEFNPMGHYEFAAKDWTPHLSKMIGKAVKVMPFHLHLLQSGYEYQFITILRNPACAEASEHAARVHRGSPMSDADKVEEWQKFTLNFIETYPHVIVQFDDLFNGKAQKRIGEFMGFDELQVAKMNDCVDPTLWHFKP